MVFPTKKIMKFLDFFFSYCEFNYFFLFFLWGKNPIFQLHKIWVGEKPGHDLCGLTLRSGKNKFGFFFSFLAKSGSTTTQKKSNAKGIKDIFWGENMHQSCHIFRKNNFLSRQIYTISSWKWPKHSSRNLFIFLIQLSALSCSQIWLIPLEDNGNSTSLRIFLNYFLIKKTPTS